MGRARSGTTKKADRPGRPKNTYDASLWMQLSAERILANQTLQPGEIKGLLELTDEAIRAERTPNAFWRQMRAVLYDQMGEEEKARQEWTHASSLNSWRDYQAERLLTGVDPNDRENGRTMSWHLAWAYYNRTSAAPHVIRQYGEKFLEDADRNSHEGLEARMVTLRNGYLMRDHAKSVETLHIAMAMIDSAAKPEGAKVVEPRRLPEERGLFTAALRKNKMLSESAFAGEVFNENDSRRTVVSTEETGRKAAVTAVGAVAAATLPSILLFLAAIGAMTKSLGSAMLRYSQVKSHIGWAPLCLFGGAMAIGVLQVTLLPLAALAVLGGSLMLAFTTKHERIRLPAGLGVSFSVTIGVLAAVFGLLVAAFLVGLSTPGHTVLPAVLSRQGEAFFEPRVAFGLAALTLTLVLLASTIWAVAQRVRTPLVLGLAVRHFGKILMHGCLAGVVILGPLSVFADLQLRETWRQIVGNEQAHYAIEFQ